MVFGCLWFPRTSFNLSIFVAFKIHNIYIYILCIYIYMYIYIYCIYSSPIPAPLVQACPPSSFSESLVASSCNGPNGWLKQREKNWETCEKYRFFMVFRILHVCFVWCIRKMRFDEVKELDQNLCRQNQLTTPSINFTYI